MTDKNHKVSVIVPCYNQAQFLAEALDSVLAQIYSNWECIVVNDGSTDNVDEVVASYLEKDSRFKYLKQENQGVAAARNNGIRHTDGEYILPLDADDMLAPTFIDKAVSYIGQHDKCKLVYCDTELFGSLSGPFRMKKYEYDKFIWANCIPCTALFRRKDFESTSGYNSNMRDGLEDWDFWLSLLTRADEVHRIEEKLFFYRMKETKNTRNEQWRCDNNRVLGQICLNHPDVYEPYYKDIIWLYDSLQGALRDKENIMHSKSYRLACFLAKLNPFRFLV